jgi:hypothetical protein
MEEVLIEKKDRWRSSELGTAHLLILALFSGSLTIGARLMTSLSLAEAICKALLSKHRYLG